MNRPLLKLKLSIAQTLLLVAMAALLVMAALVGAMGMYLRDALYAQILSRDVTLIEGVVALGRDDESGLEEVDLIEGALAASELRGVVGLVIVDAAGEPVIWAPEDFGLERIPADDRKRAETGAFGRFHDALPFGVLFPDAAPGHEPVPFAEMVLPLFRADGERVFYAWLWMDGEPLEAEFAAVDQQLLMQASIAWGGGALAVLGISYLAFLILRRGERALLARTQELAAMNQHLEMAARSAAVGSISAHLMHGLKSPLAGLRAYLRAHGGGEALEATQRMQQLVQETLRVLRQESNEGGRSLTLRQIWEELGHKWQSAETVTPPTLVALDLPDVAIPRRHANLLRLVLDNLVANASEAKSGPATITLSAETTDGSLRIFLRDDSGGIADAIRERLFTPGVSSKEQGTGLGLAISRQLMTSLRGDLSLEASDDTGSTFLVSLPLEVSSAVPVERNPS